MMPDTVVRRALNRWEYGPLEEAPQQYDENPLYYKQLVAEMDDVTGYVAQESQPTLLQYSPLGRRESLDAPVDGDAAVAWTEDTLGAMSEEDDPFDAIDFTVAYREQDGKRHVTLTGMHEQGFFHGEPYRVELAGAIDT